MFSGSMRVLSNPISCTAPPNSGSESQIICLITTFISRTSYNKKKEFCSQEVSKFEEKLKFCMPQKRSTNQSICVLQTTMLECKKTFTCPFCKFKSQRSITSNTQTRLSPSLVLAYIICLLRFLHDKFSDHGGAEFHQVWEDVCSCCPHLQVIHSLNTRKATRWNMTELRFIDINSNHLKCTMTISRAGKMPRLARVLKNASLFCGCSVCENAQNSLTKFTWEVEMQRLISSSQKKCTFK